MKQVEYYSVMENTDKTEGRGAQVDTGIAFKKQADAVKFANSEFYTRFAVMGVVNLGGTESYNVRRKVVNVYDDFNDYQKNGVNQEKLEKIQKTIDKLNPEEYNLLQEHFLKNRPTNVKR